MPRRRTTPAIKRQQTAIRVTAFRERQRESDPSQYVHVKLRKSEIDWIASGLKIKKPDDIEITDGDFDRLIADLAADMIREKLNEKKKKN